MNAMLTLECVNRDGEVDFRINKPLAPTQALAHPLFQEARTKGEATAEFDAKDGGKMFLVLRIEVEASPFPEVDYDEALDRLDAADLPPVRE